MTSEHDHPEEADLFGHTPPRVEKKTRKQPEEPVETPLAVEQAEIPFGEELRREKSTTERIGQIQALLTQETVALSLRTVAQRDADEGEYHQSFHMPADEARIAAFQTLTEKKEGGPTLLCLRPQGLGPVAKAKNPQPQFELYFCPDGVSGNVNGIKLKPEVTKEQFVQQWND